MLVSILFLFCSFFCIIIIIIFKLIAQVFHLLPQNRAHLFQSWATKKQSEKQFL